MEGNLTSLLEGAITPWVGPKDSDVNLLYGTQHDWPAYDQTKTEKITGVVRQVSWHGKPPSLRVELPDKLLVTLVIAPSARNEFRGLTEDAMKAGITISAEAYTSKQIKDELRAISLTVGRQQIEQR